MCHFTMCCCRKYPCPSHGRLIFSWTPLSPHSSGNSILVCSHTFAQNIVLLKPPFLLEFPLTFLGVGMDIFWNYTMYLLHTWIRNFHILHQNKVPIELAEGIKYIKTYVQSCNLLLLSSTVSNTTSHTVSNLNNSPALRIIKINILLSSSLSRHPIWPLI